MGQSVREQIKAEFLSLVFAAPLLHCNLAASVCLQLVSTDASESGDSVDYAEGLTALGRDFPVASEKLERARGSG